MLHVFAFQKPNAPNVIGQAMPPDMIGDTEINNRLGTSFNRFRSIRSANPHVNETFSYVSAVIVNNAAYAKPCPLAVVADMIMRKNRAAFDNTKAQ